MVNLLFDVWILFVFVRNMVFYDEMSIKGDEFRGFEFNSLENM